MSSRTCNWATPRRRASSSCCGTRPTPTPSGPSNTVPGADRPWQAAKAPSVSRVAVAGVEPHRVYHLALTGLQAGEKFGYRVSKGEAVVFESEARAPKVGRPEAAVCGLRRLRSQHARAEGDRLPDLPVEAPLRDDHRRHRLRQGPDLRISRQLLADLQRRHGVAVGRCTAAALDACSSPRRATTTSPRATWERRRTAWRTSTTGSSR